MSELLARARDFVTSTEVGRAQLLECPFCDTFMMVKVGDSTDEATDTLAGHIAEEHPDKLSV